MCSHDSRLCLHKGSLSLPLWLCTVNEFVCLYVWVKTKKGEFVFIVGRWCVHVRSIMCGVCLPRRKWSPMLHFLWSRLFSWFWFWTRGSDRQLDTLGNLWSALLLHMQVFGAFSHHGIGEEPGQHVFMLSIVYLVSVLSVYVDTYDENARDWGKKMSVQSWVTRYLLLWLHSCWERWLKQWSHCSLFIMFILACLFVLGKDIKLVRLTPKTGDIEEAEGG